MRWVADLWRRRLPTPSAWQSDAALLFGRVLIVLGLLPNGARKIETFDQTAAGMGGTPQIINGRPFPDQTPLFTFPAPEFFLGLSTVFDIAGALLIIFGWDARAVGALLLGYVLIAMTIFHSDIRGPMDVMQLIRNLPMVGGLAILAGIGAGWWSLDGWQARRRSGNGAGG
jgi:uncharacterized membrane protein YphA (DoxX/SURF4 family)